MYKKLIMALFFAGTSLAIYGQQYSKKDLIGRWTFKYKFNKGDLVFYDDSTMAFVSTLGLINAYARYSLAFNNDIIKFRYTDDIHRKKNPNYQNAEIKFLNDSTFLYKGGGKLPANADTNTEKTHVYRKIKSVKPGTELHRPTYSNLIGKWSVFFKGEIKDNHIYFIDDKQVIFKYGNTIKQATYKADLDVQPATIDFYFTDSQKMMQAFLMFEGEKMIRIEEFRDNDRGDHFTMFGLNILFVKEKAANEP